MDANDKLAVDIPSAASMISVGRSKLYELINEGKLPTVCIGRRRLVPVVALRELIASGVKPGLPNELTALKVRPSARTVKAEA